MITNPSTEKFDILILAGQSNASGCGMGETSTPYIPDERIMMFNTNFTAEVTSTPYGDMIEVKDTGDCFLNVADEREEGGNKMASFCLAFAKKYLENNLEEDRKVLLVQTAIGGTGFARNHWGENEKLAVRMFEMVDAALSMNKENRVKLVLWHQGEHDIFENARLTYQERLDFYSGKLKAFIENLRAKYGNVPFISGSFCRSWASKEDPERVNAVLDAYKTVYKDLANTAHVWEVDDLKSNSEVLDSSTDTVHFCRDSAYKLGRRYYENYIEIIKENK